MTIPLLSPFAEIALLLVMAFAIGLFGLLLRQPPIVSFIVVGVITGPSVLDVVRFGAQIDLLSQLGIAVLLFLVGIKLDVKLLRALGPASVSIGLGQVLFTTVSGYLLGLALGLDQTASVYVALSLTFSSTIIIVKLLSDKREIDSLHGRIALGILIVQDIIVILAMIALSAIEVGADTGDHAGGSVPMVLISGLAMVVLVAAFVRYAATPLTTRLAQSPELLVVFALALAAMFAAVGDVVGLGKEVGGLLAGISLASTPYRESIAARLAPLRDFLLLFFFVALGASLDLSRIGTQFGTAVLFSLFVLVAKPLIVLAVMEFLGYRRRTGFLAGLTLAQISEFSLIFLGIGVSLGHVGNDVMGMVTLVGLVTIAASTYMITYSHRLVAWCEPFLRLYARKPAFRERADTTGPEAGPETEDEADPGRIILFGLGRFGSAIGLRLQRRGIPVLGVDFNPLAVRRWHQLGLAADYGDASDPHFLAELPLAQAGWIVSTVPQHVGGLSQEDTQRTLIQLARSSGFAGRIAVTSHAAHDTEALLCAGADLVLEPFQDAADRATDLLCGAMAEDRTDIPEIETEGRLAS